MSPVTTLDDTAEAAASAGALSGIDERSLEAEINASIALNRKASAKYRTYIAKVIKEAGVRDSKQTRQLASTICGAVARLPFLPDDKEVVETRGEGSHAESLTEYDLQVRRTAAQAEVELGGEVVWTVSARKLARTALDLRKRDPEGKKGIAWVNDPFDREVPTGRVPRALREQQDTAEGEE